MKFLIQDDMLTITFQGVEQFWALKRRLVVSRADITKATWQEDVQLPRTELGWRIGGTGFPGVLFAGRFAGSEGRNFVYLLRPLGWLMTVRVKHVLTLELKDYPYRRLFFTVDRPQIAEQIIAWWSSNL